MVLVPVVDARDVTVIGTVVRTQAWNFEIKIQEHSRAKARSDE